ncbi:MAG TPA: MOSC domain-containing protein [Candidatus Dormibacteraeota bacterium]|nr:MOSC domain-containing protein [Candidatus Dormibacteraeota bacterium]
MQPRIVSIQLCPGHREPMRLVPTATLITGVGLEGDKHAVAVSDRQVLLADKEALDAVGVEPGTIKENLTVEGINVMELPVGSRLHLGASAVLEITKICEPCFRMDEIRQGLRQELEGRRGMVSRVVQGGSIHVGDPITVQEAESLAS